ncbi:ATP-binding protein [Haloarchaeobius sp. HRN-SO-5]|uniref:ATP-binding protein n=1 Tax=Haloarchaeobius sp. HRN-SO-5 TaxID=3446118 RepID=UPI003EBCF05C
MEDIGAASFTVAEAIIELVANSIDAKVEESDIEIDIFIDSSEIRVLDDAKGMTDEVLAQAVRLGVKMDQEDGSSEDRKGMFGLGMKTACASLGQRWSVTTRPIEEDKEYFIEFDLKEWSDRAGDPDFEWSIDIEEREPDEDGVLGRRDHGTAIVIKELRDYNPLAGPVLDKLGRAYKGHIESGDRIKVNGEPAQPPEYDFIEGSKVEIDTTCGDEEHRIYGWVALDTQTHNDDYFGLNLYRKGQLIEAWNKEWFKVHLMTSRIIGEIHLDFVPPNFYKRGFEHQSDEWKMVSKKMEGVLEPVVKASREASRGKDPQKFRKAARGLQKAMGSSEDVAENSDGEDDSDVDESTGDEDGGVDDEDAGSSREDDEQIQVEAKTIVVNGKEIELSYEMAEIPDEQLPWDYIYDDSTDELQAILNTGSRLLSESSDHEMLGTLALADCVAAFLTDEMAYDPADARRIRNRWLFRTMGE